ncbi:MAG TPA: CBS domain-containing protein [Pirellulales bacterium]|nr:CBS domain-containing protein [Pirellulales bacterium]
MAGSGPHSSWTTDDIALTSPLSVSPNANLLEAMRDFGSRDVETLPVETGRGDSRQLVGLLLRSDVMSRYRQEMLRIRKVNAL